MALKTNIEQEKLIYSFMLKKPAYLMKVGKDFFRNEDIQYIASYAKQYYTEYKETPTCAQMKALLKGDKREISPETVESIYNVDWGPEMLDWLQKTTEGWIRWRALNVNIFEGVTYLKTTDVSLANVNDIVDKVVGMVSDTNLITFDDSLGSDFFNPDCHVSSVENKVPFTWDYWNKCSSGGLDRKTLHCYIGGTNVGKSIVLCNDASEFVRKGKNVAFISCEMSEQKVLRRIGANLLDITLDEYDNCVQCGKIKSKLKNLSDMSLLPLGRLFVKEVPTGQCTVLDVERYIKELEEKYKMKIDVLVIDYINIMCNYRNPNSENTYIKVKQLAEDLRGIAVKYDLIIDTASQIGRDALNGTDIDITDVSESMGLMHTADSVIGMIQSQDMRIGEIDETGVAIPYYYFKILKIREGNGKDTKFRVNINYSKMKLIEKSDVIDTLSHFR